MTLKPLQWTDHIGGQRCAVSPFRSDYWIKQYPSTHPFRADRWEASCLSFGLQSFHDTPEAAMAACQNHFADIVANLFGKAVAA